MRSETIRYVVDVARLGVVALLLLIGHGGHGGQLAAQSGRLVPEELRQQVERRFDVLVVRDGLVLRPRASARDVRSVEVSGGEILVDGTRMTGAELRDRLGSDADLLIQLSYLDVDAQRKLFDVPAGRAVPDTAPPSSTPPVPSAEPPPLPEPRDFPRGRRSGERFRIGRSVTVDADEVVQGDVVAIGGSVHVFGQVRGEVVSIAGSVELGPNAVVTRDVTVVGGMLRTTPTSRIEGEVHEIGIGGIGADGDWRWGPSLATLWWGWTMSAAFALLASIVRVAVLCLLSAVVILLGRDYVERVSALAAAEPLKAGAIGFLAQVLFLPILIITIILLVITLVGIPLLALIPFAILGLGVVALIGFTAVGYQVGRLLIARLGWNDPGPIGATIAGILLLVSPILIARLIGLGGGFLYPMTFGLGLIGVLVEYLAWTVGFGAVALNRFSKRSPALPEMGSAG